MRVKTPALVALVAGSFLGGSVVSAARTQQQPPPVYFVNFMKVQPGKLADYIRLEQEVWKPVHQERVRAGQMHSWALYAVQYPYGAAREYDFVTIDVYASLADAERSIEDVLRKVHPNLAGDQIGTQTEGARSLVRGEVWQRVDQVP